MSTIYFHSPGGDAALRGAERYWYGKLVKDVFLAHLPFPECTDKREDSWVCDLVPKGSYAYDAIQEAWDPNNPHGFMRHGHTNSLKNTLSIFLTNNNLVWDGKPLDSFKLSLNTAMAAGSDAIKLAARLHGQCEIHAWVAGPNRKWLADIIRRGLEHRIFREGMGYNTALPHSWIQYSVLDLLELRDDEPVVTSFSVCDSFPNFYSVTDPSLIPGYQEDPEDVDHNLEAYNNLPVADQWRLAIPSLQPGLELKPDNWDDYGFGDGRSVFDLRHEFYVKKKASKA